MREIALDTETTGLDPSKGHRIVEIGCVELINHIPTGETYHVHINPCLEMDAEVIAVHGLTNEFLADKPTFDTFVDEFIDFLAGDPLVIHNAAFDMKFMNAEFKRYDRPTLPMTRAIDTLQIARKRFPGSPASLDALCRRFDIDKSMRVKHGALIDAELLAKVYLELVGGRQPQLLDVSKGKNTSISQESQKAKKRGEPLTARNFVPSTEEINLHNKLVESLEDNLWT